MVEILACGKDLQRMHMSSCTKNYTDGAAAIKLYNKWSVPLESVSSHEQMPTWRHEWFVLEVTWVWGQVMLTMAQWSCRDLGAAKT